MSKETGSQPHPEAVGGSGLRAPARLLSDERLARRASRGGDRGALEEVYRRYHQELYRFCLAMTGNTQDAQDALQNAMVKVLRALPGERRPIQLRPWLYRIARNEAVETLRRRRQGSKLEPDSAGSTPALAETAETRQRLRALIADLAGLPERQRAALTMRELSGLSFEQIAASFGSSAAVARQTVYEARLSLRQMDAGREMSCDAVRQKISDADGRVMRRREIRAHLRECEECSAFRDAIEERRQDLGAIAPLPAALSAGLLQGALGAGGASASAGAAGAAGAAATGWGVGGAVGAAAGSTLAKSVATVAVAGALGVTAADRGGLIDAPLPGGGEETASPAQELQSDRGSNGAGPAGAGPTGAEAGGARGAGGANSGPAGERRGSGDRRDADRRRGEGDGRADRAGAGARGAGREDAGRGARPRGLPAASTGGQEAAGAGKPPGANPSPGPGAQGGGARPARPAPPPRPSPEPPAASPPPPPAPAPAPAEPPASAEPPAPDAPKPEPAPQDPPSGSGTSVQPSP